MIIQTSCSELLVDTAIHDPAEAYDRFNVMFATLGWESSPPLSIDLLKKIKSGHYEGVGVIVYDSNGNRASLEYGGNGYITTGFRFDSNCNDCDGYCFPIFKEAIDRLDGELISCDGGTTELYEQWAQHGGGKNEDDSN